MFSESRKHEEEIVSNHKLVCYGECLFFRLDFAHTAHHARKAFRMLKNYHLFKLPKFYLFSIKNLVGIIVMF